MKQIQFRPKHDSFARSHPTTTETLFAEWNIDAETGQYVDQIGLSKKTVIDNKHGHLIDMIL